MDLFSDIWNLWLAVDEPIGTVLGGLVVVWFLVRQNVWAWPLGVAYVIVSITVLYEARLYANLLLHLVGLPAVEPVRLVLLAVRDRTAGRVAGYACQLVRSGHPLRCYARLSLRASAPGSRRRPTPPIHTGTNAVFAMSVAAMWLTARKKIENWIVWFVVNVISVALYALQGLEGYAILYAILPRHGRLGIRDLAAIDGRDRFRLKSDLAYFAHFKQRPTRRARTGVRCPWRARHRASRLPTARGPRRRPPRAWAAAA